MSEHDIKNIDSSKIPQSSCGSEDSNEEETCKETLSSSDEGESWFSLRLSDVIQLVIAFVMLVSVLCATKSITIQEGALQSANRSIAIQESALQNMNELYAAQLRPFVFSQALDVPIDLHEDGTFSVLYKMKNCGETPAFNLMVASDLSNSCNFPSLCFDIGASDREQIGCSDCATALYPTEEMALISNTYQLSVSNSEGQIPTTLNLIALNWPYYMHIEIRYTDQFSNEYVNKSTYMSVNLSEDGTMSWTRLSVEPDL